VRTAPSTGSPRQYCARFVREGVDLEIRETSGSVENIALL